MTIIWRTVVSLLTGLLLFSAPTSVWAGEQTAPANPRTEQCRPTAFLQHDMAGVYESSHMMVEVDPCGAVLIQWVNDYGHHVSLYRSEERFQAGGVFMTGYVPDQEIGAYLDSVPFAALKPAEPGWVTLISVSQEGRVVGQYRLHKTA